MEARDNFWNECCTPHEGQLNLPILPSGVSDKDGSSSWPDYGDTGFGNFVIRNGALSPSLSIFTALPLTGIAALFMII
jgi:hypothetical protein